MLEQILGRPISLEEYVDSNTEFDVVAKDGKTTEKRLQIGICALRESYSRGELMRLGWIPGGLNPEDPLPKHLVKTSTPLWNFMKKGTVELTPVGWSSVLTVVNKKKNS